MSRSKSYWEEHNSRYPHQIKVPHRSEQDIDPGKFAKMTRARFLRVPIDGVAHWGFDTAEGLAFFRKVALVNAAEEL